MSTLSKITGIARNSSEEPEPGTDLQRNAAQVEAKNALFATPAHYDKPVMPWDLIEHMESSGNALVDFLRGEAIKHIWRDKGDLKENLVKAASEIKKAISVMS
jgi:hypothetical protein